MCIRDRLQRVRERRSIAAQPLVKAENRRGAGSFARGKQRTVRESQTDIAVPTVDVSRDGDQLGIDGRDLDAGVREAVPEAPLLQEAETLTDEAHRLGEYGHGRDEACGSVRGKCLSCGAMVRLSWSGRRDEDA